MSELSGLTKKSIYADKMIARILGVNEGELVSYAELSKGFHKYIKDNGLRNPQTTVAAPTSSNLAGGPVTTAKKCRNCEAEIPGEAVFCDLCGARQ